MLTIAYLANRFPSPVEPYVGEEIQEFRRRGVCVVTGSVRRNSSGSSKQAEPDIVLQSLTYIVLLRAAFLSIRKWNRISSLVWRALFRGAEGPVQRLKALVHTFLGACYAVTLEGRGVDHIHVHHGYFGSWIAMTAARFLGVGFSVTLHGSDLLLHGAYLDVKLSDCNFGVTISEYNRRFILREYPDVAEEKVVVARLGVDVPDSEMSWPQERRADFHPFSLLAVGRLHAVKDHAFLIRACKQLAAREVPFECLIAGDGPERPRLESLIRECGLNGRITLLGHVPREQMDRFYDRADVVVLTSRSEGIPLVLMEAMARAKIVLAPAITGIPELVSAGKTGFLYEPRSMDALVDRLLFLHAVIRREGQMDQRSSCLVSAARQLKRVRLAARAQVQHNFNRKRNLELFADLFLQRIAAQDESIPNENLVLQQI